MTKQTSLRKWALLSICVAALGVGLGAGAAQVARQYFVQGPSATQIIVLPGGQEKFDSDIARLDTTTGAVYRFRGDADNPNVRNTWELRVPAVETATSGILEIQRIAIPGSLRDDQLGPQEATFLVDVVTGDTWILRHRASTNASWDPVKTFAFSG